MLMFLPKQPYDKPPSDRVFSKSVPFRTSHNRSATGQRDYYIYLHTICSATITLWSPLYTDTGRVDKSRGRLGNSH